MSVSSCYPCVAFWWTFLEKLESHESDPIFRESSLSFRPEVEKVVVFSIPRGAGKGGRHLQVLIQPLRLKLAKLSWSTWISHGCIVRLEPSPPSHLAPPSAGIPWKPKVNLLHPYRTSGTCRQSTTRVWPTREFANFEEGLMLTALM